MKAEKNQRLVASAIKQTRKALHLSQITLARSLGVPEIKVSRWETNRDTIRQADAFRILGAFEVLARRAL